MSEINDDEVFENEKTGFKINKKIIIIIGIILLIIALIISELEFGIFSNLIYQNSGMGNTIGNISNSK